LLGLRTTIVEADPSPEGLSGTKLSSTGGSFSFGIAGFIRDGKDATGFKVRELPVACAETLLRLSDIVFVVLNVVDRRITSG
jgi:hypothetical protein